MLDTISNFNFNREVNSLDLYKICRIRCKFVVHV